MDVNKLLQWNDISRDFSDTLIVGNGGSMAVCDSFGYSNLYKYGCNKAFITVPVQNIFTEISPEYKDFERVLYRLWQLAKVNEILEIQDQDKKIDSTISNVRKALLETVRGVHPLYSSVDKQKLINIGRFASRYAKVFSLNYDLTLHWAITTAQKEGSGNFSDGFTNVAKRSAKASSKQAIKQYRFDKKQFNETNIQTHIFYPHGNLALYKNRRNTESRLLGESDGLLAALTSYWNNAGIPLFVSEGTSESKILTIQASKYLRMVYEDYLPKPKSNITIIGWGMGKQDTHILQKLAFSNCQKAAVSIRKAGKSRKQLDKEKDGMSEMLSKYAGINQVVFFDSLSSGFWANGDNVNAN